MVKKLVLATNNRDKIIEISAILEGLNIEILTAGDFEDFPDIEETGETLEENARLKAHAVWNRYRLPCLADDTGLEVDYLNGDPGVFSARFAGPECSYDDNNRKLLGLMADLPVNQRGAKFKTVIAFAGENGVIEAVTGILDGFIASETRGENGFGYDPVFIDRDSGHTLAEMTRAEKNKISHRSKALQLIRPVLAEAFRR